MEPPDVAVLVFGDVAKDGVCGEAKGVAEDDPGALLRGSDSKDSVRRQDARIIENELGMTGSCVEV